MVPLQLLLNFHERSVAGFCQIARISPKSFKSRVYTVFNSFPPLNGPYEEMLRVTTATDEMASGARPMPSADESEWSDMALSRDQTRQFVTLYQVLQGFDDRA